MPRQFLLTLRYTSDEATWDTTAIDVIEADTLLSLLNQLNVLILALHKRVVLEEELP